MNPEKLYSYLFFFLIMIVGNASCVARPNTPERSPVRSATTSDKIDNVTPTETPLLSSPTLEATQLPSETASPSPSRSPTPEDEQACPALSESIWPGAKVEHQLLIDPLLHPEQTARPDQFLIFNLQTQEINLLEVPQIETLISFRGGCISPNGEWLAYGTDTDNLIIVNSEGELFGEPIQMPSPLFLDGWITDTLLWFYSTEDPYLQVTYAPFLGEWKEYPAPPIPNLFDFENRYPNPKWLLIYDPSFSRVLYRPDTVEPKAALWDLENNQQLWEIQNSSLEPSPYEAHTPKWSPDGTNLAIVLSVSRRDREELFMLGENGELKQVTNIASSFQVQLTEGFSWSPNGQFLAFWLDTRPSYDDPKLARLMILDLNDNHLRDLCVTSTYTHNVPIWAPDNHQFVLEVINENNDSKILFVDIIQNKAAIIAEDTHVYGWMTSNP